MMTKKIEMQTRRVEIIDDDEPIRRAPPPDRPKHRGSKLVALAVLILVIVGTVLLAAFIHFQCTTNGGFTLFHHSYTCKLVTEQQSVPTSKLPQAVMLQLNSKGLA